MCVCGGPPFHHPRENCPYSRKLGGQSKPQRDTVTPASIRVMVVVMVMVVVVVVVMVMVMVRIGWDLGRSGSVVGAGLGYCIIQTLCATARRYY